MASERFRTWVRHSKPAAAALLLAGSSWWAQGPADAAGTSDMDRDPVVVARDLRSPERSIAARVRQDERARARGYGQGSMWATPPGVTALGAHLAVEYAGAVPSIQVEALVRRVTAELTRAASPPDRLLHTTEAVCRSRLTDHLARGTDLHGA